MFVWEEKDGNSSLRLVSLLSLQLMYKILLLQHDTLIPLVILALYLCVELSLLLVKRDKKIYSSDFVRVDFSVP